ncbi:MAG TPA: hypothetical protein VHA52_01850 [Candidatus Babeliaceae bacterium]|nr:hypothetical protein [Candidatus Babeliaceae bacterium]
MIHDKQFENDKVCVSYVKLMAHEEIAEHYDTHPQIVIALVGGTVTRLEIDGSKTPVNFPTGKAIFRPAETPDKIHKSINSSSEPLELIIVQLK